MTRYLFCLVLLVGCPSGGDDDDASVSGCEELALPGTSWELDPGGEEGQIHPRTVLSGDVLWTAYNRPDGGSSFGVFVVGHACDGELVVPPVRVDAGDGNATDPDVTVVGGRVIVAWQTDDGASPYNLSVRIAVLDLDGELVSPATRVVTTDGEGAFTGQSWMARLTAEADGAALVLVRAAGELQWQVVVQRLDLEGAPVGETLQVTDGLDARFEPAVVSDGERLVVAWQESFDGSEGFGAAVVVGNDVSPVVWPQLDAPGIGVSLSTFGGETWAAVGRSLGVNAGTLGGEGASVPGVALAPGVAAHSGGAVVTWAEGSAANAELFMAAVSDSGFGSAVPVADGVGAYPADVVALSDDVVLVTRAVGPSPTFRIEAEVLAAP